MLEHFNSFSDYLNFGWAKSFLTNDQNASHYTYRKNKCEKVGEFLGSFVLKPLDVSIKHSRSPLFIMATAVVIICLVTIIFYPTIIPGAIAATAFAVIRVIAYSLAIATIIGLSLRTLGRLNNKDLMKAWDANLLKTQAPGAIRI